MTPAERTAVVRATLAHVVVDIERAEVVGFARKQHLGALFEVMARESERSGFVMATPIGFEPTISTVTGWRVRPLHYGAAAI